MVLSVLSVLSTPAWPWDGTVFHVTDGDTLTVLTDDQAHVVIRLWGLDAPETDQPHGSDASGHLRSLALGKQVHVQNRGIDRFGRTLAILTIHQGPEINESLILAGLAWVWPRYCNRAATCIPWAHHQEAARKAGRGLWADSNSIPPWEWRSKK